jgi:hypothetical protein
MGRKVYVSSDMSIDERLVEVAEADSQCALLWPWLLTAFDDWGRAEANAKRLKAQVFPMLDVVTPELVERALELFSNAGLITLYEVDGKRYMAVPADKWFKYQTHIRKEKRETDNSRYPAPPSEVSHDDAQVRAGARDDAQIAVNRIPSPSPSLSPSKKDSSSSKDRLEIIETQGEPRDLDDKLLPLPEAQKACEEIELRMMQHTGKQYIMRPDEVLEIRRLLASQVPLDFILAGIDHTFNRAKGRKISRFSYCVEVIKDLWQVELAKRQPVAPLRFEAHLTAHSRAAPVQPTPGPYVSREEPPELRELEEEERHAARRNTS